MSGLKSYRCHKVVQAAKIVGIRILGISRDVAIDMIGHEERVSIEWLVNRKADVGGYFVRYEDGYTSYSPAEAFEGGYTDLDDARERQTVRVALGYAFLQRVIDEGGAIVGSGSCDEMEIAFARSEGRFFVDENAMGYVLRPSTWLKKVSEQ